MVDLSENLFLGSTKSSEMTCPVKFTKPKKPQNPNLFEPTYSSFRVSNLKAAIKPNILCPSCHRNRTLLSKFWICKSYDYINDVCCRLSFDTSFRPINLWRQSTMDEKTRTFGMPIYKKRLTKKEKHLSGKMPYELFRISKITPKLVCRSK